MMRPMTWLIRSYSATQPAIASPSSAASRPSYFAAKPVVLASSQSRSAASFGSSSAAYRSSSRHSGSGPRSGPAPRGSDVSRRGPGANCLIGESVLFRCLSGVCNVALIAFAAVATARTVAILAFAAGRFPGSDVGRPVIGTLATDDDVAIGEDLRRFVAIEILELVLKLAQRRTKPLDQFLEQPVGVATKLFECTAIGILRCRRSGERESHKGGEDRNWSDACHAAQYSPGANRLHGPTIRIDRLE